MYKKLVRYDQWHFAEVDPVRLRRKAIILCDQINQKIRLDNDQYNFHSQTLPFVEAAIRGDITESLDENITNFINGNYKHDKREEILPIGYDRDFKSAVAGFSVAVQGLSLEQSQHEVIDGVPYKWLDCEEESDWPDKMPHP